MENDKSICHVNKNDTNEFKYDFKALADINPNLNNFLYFKHNMWFLDWREKDCLLELNKAILKDRFDINNWNMNSENFLIPCINSREDYIDWLYALTSSSFLIIEKDHRCISEQKISILELSDICIDIGTGCSLIYPLLGLSKYKFKFIGVDINQESLSNCNTILNNNKHLKKSIQLVYNRNPNTIFFSIFSIESNNVNNEKNDDIQLIEDINNNDNDNSKEKFNEVIDISFFDDDICNIDEKDNINKVNSGYHRHILFTMCNPPYFDSHKPYNSKKFCSYNEKEVVYPGGEYAFIIKIIEESCFIKDKVIWFTSLIGCKKNLILIKQYIKEKYLIDNKDSETNNTDNIDNKENINTKENNKPKISRFISDEIITGKQARWLVAWTFKNISIDVNLFNKRKSENKSKRNFTSRQKANVCEQIENNYNIRLNKRNNNKNDSDKEENENELNSIINVSNSKKDYKSNLKNRSYLHEEF